MTPQDASTKVDGEKRHVRGEEIPDSSVKVRHSLYTYIIYYIRITARFAAFIIVSNTPPKCGA